jgi:hypothetical protein
MRRAALVVALVLAAGCTSEASKQQQAAQTAASWAAACGMALRQWADGHTTDPFTRKALERADRDLAKTRNDVAPYALAAVDAARAQLSAARADIERHNQVSVREHAGSLADIAEQLRHAAGEKQP